MHLTLPSARASRRSIRRRGLPEPWPEHPLRQLHRWCSDMDGLLADVRAAEGTAHTLDLWGHGSMVVFTSEEARRRIIQGKADEFGHANDMAAFFVGPSSLLLLDGELHGRCRRRTLGVISGEPLWNYGGEMLEIAAEWMDGLEAGGTVNALDGAQRMTLDVIMRTVFGMRPGSEYDALHAAARDFMLAGRGIASNYASLLLEPRSVRRITLGPRDDAMNPIPEPWPISILGQLKGLREARSLVDLLLAQIHRRRATIDDGGGDALGRILRSARDEGHPLEDAAALDEALTLLLGGHDTTAVTLGWILYRLGQHADLRQKLRDELDEAFAGGPIDPSGLGRCKLLGAVVQEVLRLDGLMLGVQRRTLKDVEIDGHAIPAGTLVNAQIRHRHLNADEFDSPSSFRAERLLDRKLKPIDFAPFGGGYRRCAGAAFATYELQLLTAAIVRRVELVTPAGSVVRRVQYGPFPGPSNRIPMRVERVEARPAG